MLTMGVVCPVFDLRRSRLGLAMVRKLKLALCRSLVLAALLVGVCQVSLGQGDADLEAPGLAPFPTTSAGGGVTLFQNVRILDVKSPPLLVPANALARANPTHLLPSSGGCATG